MSTQSTQANGFQVGQTGGDVRDRETEGSWMDVNDEQGDPMMYKDGDKLLPVRILVAGTYSTQYRSIVDIQKSRMLKGRRVTAGEQLTSNQREAVAACCLAWEGFFHGAEPYECNIKSAVTLLQQAYWIQEQVEERMGDHTAFFKK